MDVVLVPDGEFVRGLNELEHDSEVRSDLVCSTVEPFSSSQRAADPDGGVGGLDVVDSGDEREYGVDFYPLTPALALDQMKI